jgi:hypothetical protein
MKSFRLVDDDVRRRDMVTVRRFRQNVYASYHPHPHISPEIPNSDEFRTLLLNCIFDKEKASSRCLRAGRGRFASGLTKKNVIGGPMTSKSPPEWDEALHQQFGLSSQLFDGAVGLDSGHVCLYLCFILKLFPSLSFLSLLDPFAAPLTRHRSV